MAERGANAGTARRASDGRRAHPAIRHRVCIRTRSGVRRLTILVPIGAGFGHGTRTRTLSRTLTGREASKCAVRPQSAARADHLRQITWRSYHHVGITTAVPIPREAPRAVTSVLFHGADMKFLFSREGRMGAPRRLQPARGRGQPDRYANVDAP